MTHFSPIQKAQTGTFCFINIPFFYVFLSSKTWQAARLSCPRVETMNLIVSLHCHRLVFLRMYKNTPSIGRLRLLRGKMPCLLFPAASSPRNPDFSNLLWGVRNLVLIAWQTGADCTMKWCWLHCKQVLFVFTPRCPAGISPTGFGVLIVLYGHTLLHRVNTLC